MRIRTILAWSVALAAVAAVVVVGLGDRPDRSEPARAVGSTAAALPGAGDPGRMLKDISAERFPTVLKAARPRPVMVNFWASWCGPCRFEMPFVTRLRARYRGRIEFIGVNYEDSRGAAESFVREFKVNFPSYRDPDGKIGQGQGGIVGMPTSIFLDGSGGEIHRQTGAFATEAAMEKVLRRLL